MEGLVRVVNPLGLPKPQRQAVAMHPEGQAAQYLWRAMNIVLHGQAKTNPSVNANGLPGHPVLRDLETLYQVKGQGLGSLASNFPLIHR